MNRLHSHKPILPIKGFVLSPRVLSSLYNATLNVFWSLLAFAPVSIFCYRFVEGTWLSAFVACRRLWMYDEPYKSVWLSEEGAKLSEELVEKLFAVK